MKKITLIVAIACMAFTGCTCGQGWRPNILSRLHDRISGGSNVGAPCDVGCAPVAAPVVMAEPECTTCGNGVMSNYGGYETDYVGGYSNESYPISAPPTTFRGPASAGELVQPAR